jgi:hypothetical protein
VSLLWLIPVSPLVILILFQTPISEATVLRAF